jgi:tyrosinase
MSIDRRRFVRTGLSAIAMAGGGLPVVTAAIPASPADAAVPVMPRMSLEEFVKDANRVADLRRGVSVMMSREPHRPDSWFFQGAIHAVRADWIAEAAQRDPKVRDVDQKRFWNQCPHSSAYGSADFLVWHRAYVHYFEGILRVAAQSPTLSLPYWNYPNPAYRKLPEIYRVPANKATNSLYIPERTVALNNGTGQLSPGTVSVDALNRRSYFTLTSGNDVFGGLIAIGSEPGNKGAIERVPHDAVHGAVGSPGWMGSVPTAAFDPIFWPHHTEIDHLFTTWACAGRVDWGPYSLSWFDAKPWYFYDASGTVQNQPRRYYVDNANLNVRYDDQQPGCVPLRAPTTAQTQVNILQRFAAPQAKRLGATRGVRLSATAPVSRVVPLATQRLLGAHPAAALFSASSSERMILEIGEITFHTAPSVAYDVYVDLPAGTSPDPAGPYHVGKLTFFGLGPTGEGMAGMPMSQGTGELFDISRLARRPGFDPSKLSVTFVPFDLVVTASGASAVTPSSDVTVGTIDVRAVNIAP